jgi:hypothetical protein
MLIHMQLELVCGLVLSHAPPVLALRLTPSAEPAHHLTVNILPGDGFFARTPNVQLFKYEHLYYTTSGGGFATSEAAKARKGLISHR